MFRVLFAFLRHKQLRVVVALLTCFLTGFATAAGDPKEPQPDASAAQAARHEPPPISYGSGASPYKFESDARKVTLEVLADGTRLYHMNGQGMQAVAAHLGADRKVEFTCSNRAEQAASGAASANDHEQ